MRLFALSLLFVFSSRGEAKTFTQPFYCIPSVLEAQEFYAYVYPTPNSRTWKVEIYRQRNENIAATYSTQVINARERYIQLVSNEMSLRMYELDEYNHRRTQVHAPKLNLKSDAWVCKEVDHSPTSPTSTY